MTTGKPWTEREQRIIAAAYLVLLERERNVYGPAFVKAKMRRAVLPLLDGRSAGSYEMKMCNISAARHAAGRFWIEGYKPLGNAQKSLLEVLDSVGRDFLPLIAAAADGRKDPYEIPAFVRDCDAMVAGGAA